MANNANAEAVETKYVGGQVPIDLYWAFKKKVADRKETTTEAVENALRLYIDLEPNEQEIQSKGNE